MTGWAPVTAKVDDKGFGGSREGNGITGIIIHHVAGTNGLGYVANKNPRSSHPTYHIANNGVVTGVVHPNRRPFSTGHGVDKSSITVEIDNSSVGGEWPVSRAALDSLIKIIVWHESQSARKNFALNITGKVQPEFYIGWHQQYSATACPGPFIINRLSQILSEARALKAGSPKPNVSIEIRRGVPGYMTATLASQGKDSITVVQPGIYNIYKSAHGMLNVSKSSIKPGAWINPADLSEPEPVPVEPEPVPVPEPEPVPVPEPEPVPVEPEPVEPEPEPEPEPKPVPVEPEITNEEMIDMLNGSLTPNVVIENPKIRRGVSYVLSGAGVIITVAAIVDSAITAFDINYIIVPAGQIVLGISALFGLSVTLPNTPKVK